MKPLKSFSRFVLATCLCSLATVSNAAELGGKAPEIQVAKWIKGGPVSLASGKGSNVFVIEFWATWCPPCLKSIPHLTELQKKFKDKGVIFVGISTEDEATVKPFVDKQGANMDYVVAVDKDGKTSDGYMKAFKIEGIPHAFVVDKEGNIVWQGHPMSDLETTLEDVVAGKLDLNKAKAAGDKDAKRAEAQEKIRKLYSLAMSDGDTASMDSLAREIEALDKEIGGIKPGNPFKADEILKKIRFQKMLRQYQAAVEGGNTNADIARMEKEIVASAPEGFTLAEFKEAYQNGKLMDEYLVAVGVQPDAAKAADLAAKLKKVKNPKHLSLFALTILTHDSITQRDIPLATRLAKAAVDGSGGDDPLPYEAYAKALFDSGEREAAIVQQKKAVEVCKIDSLKERLQEELTIYEKNQATNKPEVK